MHEKKRQKKERDKKEGRDELGGLASVFHCVNFDSRLTFLNFRACDIWFVRGLHEKNKCYKNCNSQINYFCHSVLMKHGALLNIWSPGTSSCLNA